MVKLWLIGLGVVAAGLSVLAPMSGSALREDEPVDLAFTDCGGGDVSLSGYRGKVVLLAFLADCGSIGRAQALRVERMILGQIDRERIEVVGVARQGSRPESVEKLAEAAGLSYPLLIDTRNTRSLRCPDSSALLTMVIDQDSRLAYEASGASEGEVAAVLGGLLHATRIDESTWGKIKELFK